VVLTLSPPSRSAFELEMTFNKSGTSDDFLVVLNNAVENKAWEVQTQQPKNEDFSTSRAGVTGLLRKQENKTKVIDDSLQEAFQDLDALMEKAKDMLAIAEKLQAQLSKGGNKTNEEEYEFNKMMMDIGIISPVMKNSSGDLFYIELARQISDFLQEHLKKNGGIMTLTDVYCLYNRARGTALISPDDLYRACDLFEELNLPVTMKKFDSGLIIIQTIDYTEESMCKKIIELINGGEFPLTGVELSTKLSIPLTLSNHFLEMAEEKEILCRDDADEGLIFYPNFFNLI